VDAQPPADGTTTGDSTDAARTPQLRAPSADDPGPALRLLAEALPYTDAEMITALRSRLTELDRRAGELEEQGVAAQARLGELVVRVRERSQETESSLLAAMVPWARHEAVDIVDDARRRAAELGIETGTALELGALGELLVSHFELQESLVRLISEIALDPP
jgi:predicted transcriptional regulator